MVTVVSSSSHPGVSSLHLHLANVVTGHVNSCMQLLSAVLPFVMLHFMVRVMLSGLV